MNYEEVVDYIESTPRFAKKNTPEVTREYLARLGYPDRGQRIIHVAGTNGKGSVCSYLSAILRAAGYSVGVFTSPHLLDIRERMRVDEELISREEFTWAFETVMEQVHVHHPAYFELLFLMAMVWFQKKAPDFVILEVGLGGRLDATNTVEKTVLSVITRIGLDHTQYLGDTIPLIAGEKAGIIRPGTPVVTLGEPKEALAVIRERAEELGAPLMITDATSNMTEFRANSGSNLYAGGEGGGIDFSFRGQYHDIQAKLHTHGVYQLENAGLAAQSAVTLSDLLSREAEMAEGLFCSGIPDEVIRQGLESAIWPGRMQEVLPDFFLDGGHNEDGIRAMLESVRLLPEKRRILLFAVVGDKDHAAMLHRIAKAHLFDEIMITQLRTGRTRSAAEVEETLRGTLEGRTTPVVSSCENTQNAVSILLRRREEEDIQVVCAGSLYLVAELFEVLENREIRTLSC